MPTVTVSSKGQIVLPAGARRRLGLGAGAQLEATEEPGGIHLRVVRSVKKSNIESMAGMVKLPVCGKPRRLEDFDASRFFAKPGRSGQ